MALTDDEKAELVAYLDGELDDVTAHEMEAKIATNADVRAELDALKQTWGMLDYLPKASPSANFTHRTMERLTLERGGAKSTMSLEGPRISRWIVKAGWAAAVLAALGVGYLISMLFTRPHDTVTDSDQPLVRHLRIAEKWRHYENTDDMEFLQKLTDPDLFGEDPS